jgi:glycosyltransferase involved in cell wall biosynthesis
MLLISSLERGGAERQVVELVRGLDRRRFDPFVCSLSEHVPLGPNLPDPDRDLVIVQKRWRFDATTVRRVSRVMAERRVDLVHAFLFDAEMVARLAGRLARVPVVIGSERNTDYRRPRIHAVCLTLTRALSDGLIANSNSGKRFVHRTLGVPLDRIHVIHNGINTEEFSPGDGCVIRQELGIDETDQVVGMVASFKRQKNHTMFFGMADAVHREFPCAWFLCVGEPLRDNFGGAEDYHREMSEFVRTVEARDRIIMLGNRKDMRNVYNACDVTVLTSRHEGTPNVLLESMACGVPVVATRVSDNEHIVADGNTGFIVALDDVESMAARVADLLADPGRRSRMGEAARTHVCEHFSTACLCQKTGELYETLYHWKAAAAK